MLDFLVDSYIVVWILARLLLSEPRDNTQQHMLQTVAYNLKAYNNFKNNHWTKESDENQDSPEQVYS